ncbi:unnamed protein product [Spirodela intermedia]|uniref:Uncharacterized protein n=1 Tax=Spirodela intermedia TaxID=51605 RepID=A0A7I8K1D5_SPIIN|nr:unnamed protein product [Spirodela intermedia]
MPALPRVQCRHSKTSLALRSVFFSTGGAATTRVSLCLRRARAIDALRLRLRLHDPSIPFPPPSSFSPPVDSIAAVHALRSAPSPAAALSLFRALQADPSFSATHHAFHALAKTLSLSRRADDLRSLLSANGSAAPMDLLRWYAAAGDLPAALQTWEGIRAAATDARRRHPCTESYNLVMSLYAAAGMDAEAVDVFRKMVEEGANPNSRTFTVVIEHLVGAGKLESALQVFDRLPYMRIRRTSKQYNVLAEALTSAGAFDGLRRLLAELQDDGVWPGRAVRSAVSRMLAAGSYAGLAEEELFREMVSSDERIGYVVIDPNSDDEEGDHVRLKPWLDPNALAGALEGWDAQEVAAMEEANLVWTSRLVCKFLRGFKKPESAWRFFCWVSHRPRGFVHDRQTTSRMIAILARDGHGELVERLLSKVKSDGLRLPFGTLRLVIDFLGVAKRADAAVRVFREADAVVSGDLSNERRRLLCSSLLRTLVKCRRGDDAMELLEETTQSGVLPDGQTFAGLVQFFAGEGDLRKLQAVAAMARQCGHRRDAFLCQTMIRAHIKAQRAALALRVFNDMLNSNLAPDGATKTLLVKTLWKEGKLREAAYVEQRSEEVNGGLPLSLPGHAWTVSSADLLWVYDLYRQSFLP